MFFRNQMFHQMMKLRGCPVGRKLGSMVSINGLAITYLYMGYIEGITHLPFTNYLKLAFWDHILDSSKGVIFHQSITFISI